MGATLSLYTNDATKGGRKHEEGLVSERAGS
jgi:hypothetical protein